MCTNKVPCSAPDGGTVYRPCGRCLDCLRQYQQDWTIRISEECKAWSSGSVIFFTLTYSDSMLPVMVTFNHPITLNSYQFICRNRQISSFLSGHFSSLGLDSFYYTRSVRNDSLDFRNERKCFQDSYLDIPEFKRPALMVPSCYYDDINSWIRYCRKYYDRHFLGKAFRDKRVNEHLESLTWINNHGVESCFPDSAYTPSFKYWICTEYGPETLRPHVHGVMFGVDEDTFRDVFAKYWRDRFGSGSPYSVKFSVYDPEKGGALYISKYCSKGSFDHPLVTRSIHYPSGKEYISGEYVHCVDWFGFDSPMCVPPFRLISKGIGIRYPFNASVQKYWDISCDEFTDFVCRDAADRVVPMRFLSQVTLNETTSLVKDSPLKISGYLDLVDKVHDAFCSTFSLRKVDDRKRCKLIGESSFVVDPTINDFDFLTFQDTFYNKKFFRSYFHHGQINVYSSLLPRYYRRYLLSPFSQVAICSSLSRLSNDDFNRKRRQVRSQRSEDSHDAAIRQIQYSERFERSSASQNISRQFNKFYSRVFAGDFISSY